MSRVCPPPQGFTPPPVEKINDDELLFILKQYLTPAQFGDERIHKFIVHYITHRSHTEAAEFAGLPRAYGARYRATPQIHAAIEAITAKAVMKYGYDAHEVMERIRRYAMVDPIAFQNPDGSFKTHLSQIDPEWRVCIKKFKAKNLYGEDANGMRIVIGQLIDVELHDSIKALEHLGTEKNILKKTTVVEHDVTTNMQNFLLESSKRADERKALIGKVRDVEESTGDNGDDGLRAIGGVSVAVGGGQSFGGGAVHDIEDVSGEATGDDTGSGEDRI